MNNRFGHTAYKVEDVTPELVEGYRYHLKKIFDSMIEAGCPVKSDEMHASIDLLCNAALKGLGK